jgi:hypothetical protein
MDVMIVGILALATIKLPLTCTSFPDLRVKDHILHPRIGDQAPAQDSTVASSRRVVCDIDRRDNPVFIWIMIGVPGSVGRVSNSAIAHLRAPGRHLVYLRL